MIKPAKRKVRKRKNPSSSITHKMMEDFVGKNIKIFFKGSKVKGFVEGKLWREKESYEIENNHSAITFKSSELLNIGWNDDNMLIGTIVI